MRQYLRTCLVIGQFVLFLLFFGIPTSLFAQWAPNGLVLHDVINQYMMLPTEDGGHWVIYDTALDLEYYCGQVQRYDADGNAQFPGHGYYAGLSIVNPFGHNAQITGAVTTPDSGIIVGFESTTLIPEYGSCMFAQKITYSGELAWGDSGVVALADDDFQSPWPMFPSITSDGNGGFWGYYLIMPTTHAYLYGINADGSQKLHNPTLIRSDADGLHAPMLLVAHPDGGVFIMYEDITPTNRVGLYLQRFSSEGDPVWDDPVLAMPYTWQHQRDIKILPDNSVVVFNATSGGNPLYMCRISEDGAPIWDPYLDLTGEYSQGSCSNMILMPDNSLAFLRVWISSIYHDNRLYRINADGTPYFGNDWYISYTPPMKTTSPYMGIELTQNPPYAFTYGRIQMPDMGHQDRNLMVQLLDLNTTLDQFAGDTILTTPDDFFLYVEVKSMLSNDNSLILAAVNPDDYSTLQMFKILSDGTVVGQDQSVREASDSIPSTFTIIDLYPNPFNRSVTLTIDLPAARSLDLSVTNLEGRQVDHRSYSLASGRHQVVWEAPPALASGVLFFRLDDAYSRIVRRVVYEK